MNHSESGLNPSKGQTAETKSPLSLLQSLLPPGDATLTERHPDLERRKDERMPIDITAKWDYFTLQSGTKTDRIANLSRSGALLCCDYPIELRRWIRLSISAQPAAPETNPVSTILVGRVVRRNGFNDVLYALHHLGKVKFSPCTANAELLRTLHV